MARTLGMRDPTVFDSDLQIIANATANSASNSRGGLRHGELGPVRVVTGRLFQDRNYFANAAGLSLYDLNRAASTATTGAVLGRMEVAAYNEAPPSVVAPSVID